MPEPWNSYGGAFALPAHADYQVPVAGLASPSQGAPSVAVLASSAAPAEGCSGVTTDAGFGSGGATAAQVQQALDESGLSVNGAGIKVGVLSDSFNALGGAAADEADGALPSASNVQVLQDFLTGGSDEGRAMMQVIHDIAPGASEAFYTAEFGQQAFANGILALAAAGCKVICDDANYFDEPFFQDGVIGQAIKTVEAEGVTYITAAGNNASAGYQAAWTPISGSFDGVSLTDAECFGGSLVQTVTVNTEGSGLSIPLLLEWNQPYGGANTSDLEVFVFQNGSLVGSFTNLDQEPNNPLIDLSFNASGTYQIAIEKLSGSDPGLIKEIGAGNGLPITISGANVGTVFGHALTPGVIAVGAVSAADTPAFGFSAPLSEAFSSSGAGVGTALCRRWQPAGFAGCVQCGCGLQRGWHRHDASGKSRRFFRHFGCVSEPGRRSRSHPVGQSRSHPGASPADHGGDGGPDGQFGRERRGFGSGRPRHSRGHGTHSARSHRICCGEQDNSGGRRHPHHRCLRHEHR